MKKLFVLTILFFFNSIIFAQHEEKSFTVSINFDTVEVNEIFQVSFKINNCELEEDFQHPDFNDLELVNGPSISQSISIVNGNKSQQFTYTYNLRVSSAGIYFIPEHIIETDAGTLVSGELPLVVVDKLTNPRNMSDPVQSEDPLDFFNNNSFYNDFFNDFNTENYMDKFFREFDEIFRNELELLPDDKRKAPTKKLKKKEKVYRI